MKHKQFIEWLQLSSYSELCEKEKKLLNKHLKACSQCRTELEGLKRLHSILAQHKPATAEKSMLQDARRDLRLRIHAVKTHEIYLE